MYQIPRKTYRDFHSDLYPDIFVPESSLTAVKWIQNDQNDLLREKISINPQKSLKVCCLLFFTTFFQYVIRNADF